MKRFILSILVIICTLNIFSIAAYADDSAYTFDFDMTSGKIYKINIKSQILRLDVVVPESINGIKVRSIGSGAFKDCYKIEKIILPDTIEDIGEYSFISCVNLKEINIPKKVSAIGKFSFYGCGKLETIDIPDNINEIEEYTFIGCENLNRVSLPKNLKVINKYAFQGCSNLNNFKIPDSVEYIGKYAFSDCYSMNIETLPQNLKIIDEGAFTNCYKLKKIRIHDNIEYIGRWAFNYCGEIEELTVNSTIINTIIELEVFLGANKIDKVNILGYLTDGQKKQFINLLTSLGINATYINYIDEDINKDGKIDLLDLAMISNYYNSNDCPKYDLNMDGIIDIYDIVKVARLIL